jgi:hypothetical protein
MSAARLQVLEHIANTCDGDVRVEVLVLFPVDSVSGDFRGLFEMDREPVTRDACVEILVLKFQLEAERVAVVRNRPFEIVDEKLRRYSENRHVVRETTVSTGRSARSMSARLAARFVRCPRSAR